MRVFRVWFVDEHGAQIYSRLPLRRRARSSDLHPTRPFLLSLGSWFCNHPSVVHLAVLVRSPPLQRCRLRRLVWIFFSDLLPVTPMYQ
ncbi:hypothetical protein U1Q18_024776 [Sarracenia purpurea var. burkii]